MYVYPLTHGYIYFQMGLWTSSLGKAGNALTVAPSPHRCGAETVPDITYVTPAVSTIR